MRQFYILTFLLLLCSCRQDKTEINQENVLATNERLKHLVLTNLKFFDNYSLYPQDSIYFNKIMALKKDFLRLYAKIDSLNEFFTDSIMAYRAKYLPDEKGTIYLYSQDRRTEVCLSSLEIIHSLKKTYISSYSLIKKIKPRVRQTSDSVFISICVDNLDNYTLSPHFRTSFKWQRQLFHLKGFENHLLPVMQFAS